MKVPTLPVLGQVLGLAAFLAGLFLMAGLPWTLLTGGLVVTLWCTAAEALGGPSAPSVGRSGPNTARGE